MTKTKTNELEEIEDLELDEIEELESDNEKSNIKRNTIIMLNDDMRINIKESEISMFFERKSKHKKEEVSEDKWNTDGYFTKMGALLKYVIQVCAKEHIFSKKISDYRDLFSLYNNMENEMMEIGERIESQLLQIDREDMKKLKLVSGYSENVIREMIEHYNNR